MLKKFRFLVLLMVLILVVVSCSTFAAVKPIKLVYGHVWPADHYYVKGDLYLKKLVEKNSKGQMIIDLFPASQLGTQTEQMQALRSGAQQMFLGGNIDTYWSKWTTTALPYIYRDDAHQQKVAEKLTSLIDQDEVAAKVGVHILGVRTNTPRQLVTKFPVNKLEDLKGRKMRVPETEINKVFWRALGTVPTVIPVVDVYTALATGIVDGLENHLSDIYSFKFYEQVKYCTLTSHVQGFYLVLINNNFWNGLTKKQQKILTDAEAKVDKMIASETLKKEKEYIKLLSKEGMVFSKIDLAPFREKAKTIWNRFGDPELIKKIQAVK
jgi:tripartite ATP-independent transporter DctP family solute receptor